MTGQIDLSVVVVTWNSRHDIHRCLASVTDSSRSVREIIVVDNGSTDGTVEHVRRFFPSAVVIRNGANLGHARAANIGFERARGRYVVILDADTEFRRELLPAMVDFLEREPSAHICAPRLYYPDGRLQETNRNLPTPAAAVFGRRSLVARLWPGNPLTARYLRRDLRGETRPHPVQQVSAAVMMFRRDMIERIGGWDEGFFAYWLDTEWCIRAGKAGLGVWSLPHLSATHHESNRPAVRKTWRRLWMFHRGAMRLYRLHYAGGPLDPRCWVAGALLMVRFALLAAIDPFLPPAPANGRGEASATARQDRTAAGAKPPG
ncbi:MAG: glycosyltransferase family 2 protein [Rhodospirillales bacterium]|nr:MAG: glycosyltransferase family 2 protein [Rhodospirillales bacterium]